MDIVRSTYKNSLKQYIKKIASTLSQALVEQYFRKEVLLSFQKLCSTNSKIVSNCVMVLVTICLPDAHISFLIASDT